MTQKKFFVKSGGHNSGINQTSDDALAETLNELAADGYEIFSVLPVGQDRARIVYSKDVEEDAYTSEAQVGEVSDDNNDPLLDELADDNTSAMIGSHVGGWPL